MTLRNIFLLVFCHMAFLVLSPAVTPAIGQTNDAVSSRRVDARTHVKLTDAPVPAKKPIEISRDNITRTAHNNLLRPIIIPPKTSGGSVMRLPRLADPEKFKVKKKNPIRGWISLQDKLQDKKPNSVLQEQAKPELSDEDEIKLLSRLPRADLNAGISPNSIQRAVNYPDVPNPNLSFAENARLAPTMAISFQPATKTWRSPDMVHRPLYFEQGNLERYGNGIGRWQPVASGVHFFSSVLMLPYKMGSESPKECDYSMGHFRPGDCVPAYKSHRPLSFRGAIFEGLAIGTVLGGL